MTIEFGRNYRSNGNRNKACNKHKPINTISFLEPNKPAIAFVKDFAFRIEMMRQPVENEFTEVKENKHPQGSARGGNQDYFNE